MADKLPHHNFSIIDPNLKKYPIHSISNSKMLFVTRSDNTKINSMDLFNTMLYNPGIYLVMCNCIIVDRGDMT